MLHNHQRPKLTIPYSILPEMLICQDRDARVVLKRVEIKIENNYLIIPNIINNIITIF